jgi:pimeloyl-CoA synthetase
MTIIELYKHGIIGYLFKKGLLSGSIMAYMEYYQHYQMERKAGSGYRESVRKLSREFGVSETTIKKAIRLIQERETSSVAALESNLSAG